MAEGGVEGEHMAPSGSGGRERQGPAGVGEERGGRKKGESRSSDGAREEEEEEREIKKHGALFSSTPVIPPSHLCERIRVWIISRYNARFMDDFWVCVSVCVCVYGWG